MEKADVDLRRKLHVEVGVGLHDGAAVERHVGRPRVDEHRAGDAGDVADPAAGDALEDEVRLPPIAVEDPCLAGYAERPEADVDRAHETRPDPARVKHEARRAVERHAASRQPPVAGDSHRVRRHAAEHVAVTVVIPLAGPTDRPHLPLDRARVHLEEHRGVEREHARHADDAAADSGRFKATEQAAARARDVRQCPGDPQRLEHRKIERGVECECRDVGLEQKGEAAVEREGVGELHAASARCRHVAGGLGVTRRGRGDGDRRGPTRPPKFFGNRERGIHAGGVHQEIQTDGHDLDGRADGNRIGVEHHPRHDAAGVDPQEGLNLARDPRAALGADPTRAIHVEQDARPANGEEDVALKHRDIEQVDIDGTLGFEKGFVVGEHDCRAGNRVACSSRERAVGIDDRVGRPAEIDHFEVAAGREVDVEREIRERGVGEFFDADEPGLAERRRRTHVNGGHGAQALRHPQHEDRPDVEVVDGDADGPRIDRQVRVDAAGLWIAAPVLAGTLEPDHVVHREAERVDLDLAAIGKRHPLAPPLGEREAAGHLQRWRGEGHRGRGGEDAEVHEVHSRRLRPRHGHVTAGRDIEEAEHRDVEVADIDGDHFLVDVDDDRVGRVTRRDLEAGATRSERRAREVEGRHRQRGGGHGLQRRVAGCEGQDARVDRDRHVFDRGDWAPQAVGQRPGDEALEADLSRPADGRLGSDVGRQHRGDPRHRDARHARCRHDRQAECDILDLDADPLWLAEARDAVDRRHRHAGEALQVRAADLERVEVVGEARARHPGNDAEHAGISLRTEDLASGLDGE